MHHFQTVSTHVVRFLLSTVLAAVACNPASAAQDPGPLPSTAPTRAQSHPAPAPPPPATSQPSYHTSPPPEKIHSPGDSPITNEPPSQPVEEVIKRFAEREAEFQRERNNYTYSQTVSVQTLDDDDRPDGDAGKE